jgi:transcriptional regulator GlxA family with amidase domain
VDGTDVIETTVHYMQENLSRKMTLQEMADYTGYPVSHFSAVFKQRTGLSPVTYFNQLRIRKACDLLVSSDMTVTQISHRLGIDDQYYFSRLFSESMGISPKEYRRQHRPS